MLLLASRLQESFGCSVNVMMGICVDRDVDGMS